MPFSPALRHDRIPIIPCICGLSRILIAWTARTAESEIFSGGVQEKGSDTVKNALKITYNTFV